MKNLLKLLTVAFAFSQSLNAYSDTNIFYDGLVKGSDGYNVIDTRKAWKVERRKEFDGSVTTFNFFIGTTVYKLVMHPNFVSSTDPIVRTPETLPMLDQLTKGERGMIWILLPSDLGFLNGVPQHIAVANYLEDGRQINRSVIYHFFPKGVLFPSSPTNGPGASKLIQVMTLL
jgi:hypothetical protein